MSIYIDHYQKKPKNTIISFLKGIELNLLKQDFDNLSFIQKMLYRFKIQEVPRITRISFKQLPLVPYPIKVFYDLSKKAGYHCFPGLTLQQNNLLSGLIEPQKRLSRNEILSKSFRSSYKTIAEQLHDLPKAESSIYDSSSLTNSIYLTRLLTTKVKSDDEDKLPPLTYIRKDVSSVRAKICLADNDGMTEKEAIYNVISRGNS